MLGSASGHRKHGVVGDVVNVAARLQAQAPVGGVLIGEETFRELGAGAVVEALPPQRVKGKERAGLGVHPPRTSSREEPVATPRALPVAPDALRRLRAMGTPHAAETPGRLARLVRAPIGFGVGLTRALPRAIDDLFRDRCPQYAAAIAYRVLFSLFPLTILLVSVFGLVLQDDELRERVISELLSVLPVSETGGRTSRARSSRSPLLCPRSGSSRSSRSSGARPG